MRTYKQSAALPKSCWGGIMELGDAIHSAVTTRYFGDEPVTDEQLKTAFNYARFAPQGGNRQPV